LLNRNKTVDSWLEEVQTEEKTRLEGKRVLIVDDEVDVLDSLESLMPMCKILKAGTYEDARRLFETQSFDLAILDIMGVEGYRLLEIATAKGIAPVMLTANALSPQNLAHSYKMGAAYFVPKEGLIDIVTFMNDVLGSKEQGRNLCSRWLEKWSYFFEKRFGPDW
jgi:DNA-binding response OmpR family regulator